MEQAPTKGIFYGWWIVAVCLLVLLVHAGIGFYSFSVLNKTLQEAFNTGRATISGAVSLYMLMTGLTAPFVGKLTDRYGPKKVVLWGALISGAAFLLLNRADAVWHLYVLFMVAGVGMGGAGIVPVSVAVSNWFTRRRGLAIGVAMSGIGLGALLVTLLTSYLVDAFGWRVTFFALGAVAWVFVIPATMLIMKTRPQDMGLLPDGAKPAAIEVAPAVEIARATANPEPAAYTLSTALRSPTMWSIMVAAFFIGMAITGVLLHEHAFFTDRGISMASAGVMLAVTGGTGGIGKLTFGFLADRILPRHGLMISLALQILAVVILLFTEGTAMMWVFVIVFGFGMGGNIALQPLLTTQFFGLASFGAIFGGVAMALSIGTAVGPFLSGLIFDVSGSYRLAFIIFIVGYTIALAALILARKPKARAVEP
jgi:MFS family permease